MISEKLGLEFVLALGFLHELNDLRYDFRLETDLHSLRDQGQATMITCYDVNPYFLICLNIRIWVVRPLRRSCFFMCLWTLEADWTSKAALRI